MIENEKEQDFLGKISQQPDSQVEDEDKGSSKPLTKNQLQRIKEGALENCSLKEWQLQQCMKQGSLTERLTMCWQLRQGFWDCVEQQKELLKKGGYGRTGNTERQNLEILNAADLQERP